MDLLSYFRMLRRRWLLIFACVVIGAAVGAATTLLDSKAGKTRTYYKATNTQIFDGSSSSGAVPSSVNNIDQIAVLITTGDVPDKVAKSLGTGESGRQLAQRITTTTNGVTTTIDITAADPSPKQAEALANAFAKEIEANLVARDTARYDASRDDLQKRLGNLKIQANGFLAQLALQPRIPDFDTVQRQYDATQNQYYDAYGKLQALTSAGAPTSRLSALESSQAVPIGQDEYRARLDLGALGQNHLRADATGAAPTAAFAAPSQTFVLVGTTSRTILGALLGLLVGIGLAVVADRLDRRIRTRTEAEAAFGLPVLAEIPRFTRAQARALELMAFVQPRSRTADAFRAVRTSLLFQQSSLVSAEKPVVAPVVEGLYEPGYHDCLVVMVTSASPREGKTTTSANLAAVFAEAGEAVLLINCDFRRPMIHQHFGVPDVPRTVQETTVPGLKIVTNVLSDPNSNPAQVVAAQRQVVAAARNRFGVIILDTAPMLAANDAIEAASVADLVLLVARASITTTDKAQRAVEILTRLEAPIGGVVLVAGDEPTNDYYYYYQRGRLGRQKQSYGASYGNASSPNGASTNRASTNGASANGASTVPPPTVPPPQQPAAGEPPHA